MRFLSQPTPTTIVYDGMHFSSVNRGGLAHGPEYRRAQSMSSSVLDIEREEWNEWVKLLFVIDGCCLLENKHNVVVVVLFCFVLFCC